MPARPGEPRNGPPRTGGDWRPNRSAGDDDGRGDDDGAGGDRSEDGEQEPTLQVLGVDSALAPYLGPQQYSERVRDLEPAVESSGRAAEQHAPVASARRAAPSPPPSAPEQPTASDPGQPFDPADAEPPAPEPAGPISLGVQGKTGRYSRDLFAEVGRYAMVLADIARREGHDVVHAHDWMTFPGGVAASRASGKPLVVHVHSCEYDRSGDGANPRIVEIEQAGMDAADLVVCVSHYTASVVALALPRRRPRRSASSTTPSRAASSTSSGTQEKAIDEPVVLFLGRVTFQKGPDYFLEAAALRGQGWSPRAVRAGRLGRHAAAHDRDARRSSASRATCFFTGFLRGDDVERMYAMADLYVMPSVSEPFGIAPLEAMALDVPVIVSRQSGVAEVLQHALKVDFWDVRRHGGQDPRRAAATRAAQDAGRVRPRRGGPDAAGTCAARHLRDLYQELVS